MLKSRLTCGSASCLFTQSEIWFTSVAVVFSLRYYDNKRSAEKKEHKTIEAADKV